MNKVIMLGVALALVIPAVSFATPCSQTTLKVDGETLNKTEYQCVDGVDKKGFKDTDGLFNHDDWEVVSKRVDATKDAPLSFPHIVNSDEKFAEYLVVIKSGQNTIGDKLANRGNKIVGATNTGKNDNSPKGSMSKNAVGDDKVFWSAYLLSAEQMPFTIASMPKDISNIEIYGRGEREVGAADRALGAPMEYGKKTTDDRTIDDGDKPYPRN